jgi:pimeloyl-ACP methyl ester carboxylesterase
MRHYNEHRPHRGFDLAPPRPDAEIVDLAAERRIRRKPLLGGASRTASPELGIILTADTTMHNVAAVATPRSRHSASEEARTMPTVQADDHGSTVHYTTAGRGPGLVFVAGTGLAAQTNFGHLIDAFMGERTVVLPDYAGSGATVEPAGELTVEILAAQIAAVVREVEAAGGPVDLVGYSLGAVVAAAVAAAHPSLIRRLVLVAGWAGPDARHELNIDVWQKLELADHDLFNRFLQLAVFSPDFLSAIGSETLAGLIQSAPPIGEGMRRHIDVDRRVDIRDLLPKITAPTLVIGLTHDYVVPVGAVRRLHEAISGSEFAEISSGHAVVFERPQELVEAVARFLFTDPSADPITDQV